MSFHKEKCSMSNSHFDPLIHAQNRLQICAMLASSVEIEFKILRDELAVSDSVLSKHLKALEDAGYITLSKRSLVGRQRTWISLTLAGKKAYQGHVSALQAIVGSV